MTDEELRAIEARAEAAIEGPWAFEPYQYIGQPAGTPLGKIRSDGFPVASSVNGDDAAFIAAARVDVPALIAAVRHERAAAEAERALRKAIEALDASLATLDHADRIVATARAVREAADVLRALGREP